jgi:hypothetical protein
LECQSASCPDLERLAVDAHLAGDTWAEFWPREAGDVAAAEPVLDQPLEYMKEGWKPRSGISPPVFARDYTTRRAGKWTGAAETMSVPFEEV